MYYYKKRKEEKLLFSCYSTASLVLISAVLVDFTGLPVFCH